LIARRLAAHGLAELRLEQRQQKPDPPGRRGIDRQVEPGSAVGGTLVTAQWLCLRGSFG
jgi:hypothetical protein